MTIVTANLAISLDGFTAGPGQTLEQPFGTGADALTTWMLQTDQPGREADRQILSRRAREHGRPCHGPEHVRPRARRMGPRLDRVVGPRAAVPRPVFVLTHHERDPLPMEGGTTFTFVTDGIEPALEQARAAAGGKDVEIAGGASAVRQYLKAGLLDELVLHLVPVVLGAGERLLEGLDGLAFEPVEVIASPAVTHLRYRVPR